MLNRLPARAPVRRTAATTLALGALLAAGALAPGAAAATGSDTGSTGHASSPRSTGHASSPRPASPRTSTSPASSVPAATMRPRGNPRSVGYLTTPIARWNPCTPIRYRVNLTGAPKGAAADVDRAVAAVAKASGLRFVKAGTTKTVPGSRGADVLDTYPRGTQVVIAYVRPGQSGYIRRHSDTLAVGGAFYRDATTRAGGRSWHRIIQGYVVLDRTQKLPGGFGAGNRYGLQGTWGQVLMHELGHVVGLDHPKIKDPTQIMYWQTTRKTARWGAGDLTGLRKVGRASGCLPAVGTAKAAISADRVTPPNR